MSNKEYVNKLMQEITDTKVQTKIEFLKWAKNDFNGNGISDYLEKD